jgi:acetyl esterase/lipase
VPACHVTDLRLWDRGRPKDDVCAVVTKKDVAYFDGPGADTYRHRVDLFLPKGKTDFPIVVLVHGGAWMMGDNRCCGLYSTVGEYLASQGIGAILPNYRLSPSVKHPEHVKDVARAFAWTKHHIKDYGGDPKQMFLVGHSAGGHLVALLATDEQYLKAHGCKTSDIKGVVGISGVYRIPEGKAAIELGGTSPKALRADAMSPLRDVGTALDKDAPPRHGLPLGVNIFAPVFGDDPRVRLTASPAHHVRQGLPPFLLISADKDLPLLPDMAKEFHELLCLHGCDARHVTIPERNHNSIMFKAIVNDDLVGRAVVDFVRARASR